MGENFLLKWNDHSTSILSATSLMFQSSGLTDVTIGTSDRSFRAHKLVLSICSSTFAQLFGVNGTLSGQQNPYIYMQDVPSKYLETLLRYMYEGEVSVEEADLAPLLTTARGLGIKGLCEVDNKSENKTKQQHLSRDQGQQQLLLPQSPQQQQRKKKRKLTDNNNFVAGSVHLPSSELSNGVGGGMMTGNIISLPIEVDPTTEDIIEVDSTKFDTGYDDNIAEDEGLEDIPEDWLEEGEMSSEGGVDKNLACNFCPKIFNSNWHLKRHMMTHTRDTRFTCHVCQKDFSRNDNLKSHMRTIHGVILPTKPKSVK